MYLVDYAEWITNEHHINHGLIALPPIQRSSVWKPVQIVDLWDSLLRGMPFGSFFVARMKAGDVYRRLEGASSVRAGTDTTRQSTVRFFLLDGQQRTLTMLLGYRTHLRVRLWLDLGQHGTQGRTFALRLTTESQPFGFDPNDASRKLSADQKREAREAFVEAYPKNKGKHDHQLPLQDTRPWKATLPIPLVELWKAWRECGRGSSSDEWWKNLVGNHYGKIQDARPEIVAQLRPAFGRLDSYSFPLILVPNDVLGATPEGQDSASEDVIEMLYTRIGTGGTVLSVVLHR
jgi:hypothetical protein